jgi:hypothetical protein
MSNFILDTEKDFASHRARVPGTETTLELKRIDNKLYSIFYHYKDSVFECGTFNKSELKTLWKMLTAK